MRVEGAATSDHVFSRSRDIALWIVARLTPHWKRLLTFLDAVSRLEDLYWKGHWPGASSTPRPTALAMKTVCDFADDEKVDRWQKVAARISSVVLGAFLERYIDEMTAMAGSQ
jgi:hypothetical protein